MEQRWWLTTPALCLLQCSLNISTTSTPTHTLPQVQKTSCLQVWCVTLKALCFVLKFLQLDIILKELEESSFLKPHFSHAVTLPHPLPSSSCYFLGCMSPSTMHNITKRLWIQLDFFKCNFYSYFLFFSFFFFLPLLQCSLCKATTLK